jgi:hypothetical protein
MKSGWTELPCRMVEKWSCTAEPTAIAGYAVCTRILQIAKARRNTLRSFRAKVLPSFARRLCGSGLLGALL